MRSVSQSVHAGPEVLGEPYGAPVRTVGAVGRTLFGWRPGGPEVLHFVNIDEPTAGPGEIRIAVHAAGVNSVDKKIRSGAVQEQFPVTLPAGTGVDAAGVVDQVGSGVTGVAVGNAVFGGGSATYAEFAVLSAWAAKPPDLPFPEAAGLPMPVETAIRILAQVGVEPGQTLLVSGAAGGVGSAVVQIARERGINVIDTASAGNQDYLRSLGAVATTYGDGLVERVRTLAPSGIDAALDIAGSGVVPDLIELTGNPGKVLSIADFGAAKLGAKVSSEPKDPAAAYAEAARLVTAGKLHLPVERTFALADAAAAQSASQAGHVAGRTIVTVA